MNKSVSCLLVSYAGMPYTSSCFFLDNGLANLAGSLVKSGHFVKVLDYNTPEVIEFVINQDRSIQDALKKLNRHYRIEDDLRSIQKEHEKVQKSIDGALSKYYEIIYQEIRNEVLLRKINMMGFKLWIGRGTNTIIRLVRELRKEFPYIKYFAGGPAASLFYEYIDGLDIFDAVCIGEGEVSIAELAQYTLGKKELKSIERIIYKINGKWIKNVGNTYDLDDIVFPEYSDEVYPASHNVEKKIRVVTLDESRGCNNKCAFCTHSLLGGNKVRTMTKAKLKQVIDYCINELHTSAFNLGGSCVPGKLLEELADINIRDKRMIKYNCFTNVNDLQGCDLKKIHQGGLFSVFFGIESYHPDILKRGFNKYLNIDETEQIIKSALAADIYVTCSFIYPAPFETEITRNYTKEKIIESLKCNSKGAAVVFYPGLMPGSRWSKEPDKYGITAPDMENHFKELAGCEIRHYLPISYWDTYDYKINGQNQKELAVMSDEFTQELEENGVNINTMGDTALLAYYLNEKIGVVGDQLKSMFLNMDYQSMYTFVENVNQGIVSV